MSTWNYRVIKFPCSEAESETGYMSALAEVYYEDNGEVFGWCVRRPFSEDMQWLLNKYQEALNKPTLEVEKPDSFNE